MTDYTEFEGYSTFHDIEDIELRNRNRAAVLWNMYEANTKKKKTTAGGVATMIGYMRTIPEEDRQEVMDRLTVLISGKEGKA